jgi:hypothetical protein
MIQLSSSHAAATKWRQAPTNLRKKKEMYLSKTATFDTEGAQGKGLTRNNQEVTKGSFRSHKVAKYMEFIFLLLMLKFPN